MVKMVNLLVRDDGTSHEAFVERFREEHVPMAEELPGLVRYVTAVPRDPERSAYDAVAELYFEDGEALSAAFDSGQGQRVQADAAAFADVDGSETLVVDESVHVDG